MLLPRIRLITFDATGTLMKHKRPAEDQYAKVISKHLGQTCDVSVIKQSFKQCYKEHTVASPLFGFHNGIACETWWMSVFFGTLLHAGVLKQAQLLRQSTSGLHLWTTNNHSSSDTLNHMFYDIYNHFQWGEMPFAHSVLESLSTKVKDKENKIAAVGVISNNDDRIPKILNKTGLGTFVNFVVTSYEAGCEKPNLEIFHKALAKANQTTNVDQPIKIEEMLHIGDSLSNDYFGATNAGANALLLDPQREHVNNEKVNPHNCIPDLQALFSNDLQILH